MLNHGVVDDMDQFVHPLAKIAGADEPILAVLELLLSLLMAPVEQLLQLGDQLGAQIRRIADRLTAEAFEDALGAMDGHGTTAHEEPFDLSLDRASAQEWTGIIRRNR